MTKLAAMCNLRSPAIWAIGLLSLTCASAQTSVSDDRESEAWRFQLTPYVWMTGLEGHISPFQGAPTAHVDKSFSDVLKKLDAAAFIAGTARKGQIVLQGDFTHSSTSDAASLPQGFSAVGKVRQTSLTLIGGYNWSTGAASSIDLMAGIRLWDIKATVQVPGLVTIRSNTSFVDPIVAARWRYDLAPRWSTLIYADAGGFGLGSDTTWQVLGSVNYQLRDNIYLSLGYRHLGVNYRDRGKRLDFTLGGPLIGATLRF
ncbi:MULTISPECIES: hypothetical protein [unclassified Variovorax]|uniref:hypothetical protein n=1 Tax=unclassified Variovorax TaxID=663243 RepID=UPI0032E7E28C